MIPKNAGPCRGSFLRWHYNAASSKCEEFIFGGCIENNNNYLSEQECSNACKNVTGNDDHIALRPWCTVGLKEYLMLSLISHSLSVCFFRQGTQKENSEESPLGSLLHKNVICHTIREASVQLYKSFEINVVFTDCLLATVPKLNVSVVHVRCQ